MPKTVTAAGRLGDYKCGFTNKELYVLTLTEEGTSQTEFVLATRVLNDELSHFSNALVATYCLQGTVFDGGPLGIPSPEYEVSAPGDNLEDNVFVHRGKIYLGVLPGVVPLYFIGSEQRKKMTNAPGLAFVLSLFQTDNTHSLISSCMARAPNAKWVSVSHQGQQQFVNYGTLALTGRGILEKIELEEEASLYVSISQLTEGFAQGWLYNRYLLDEPAGPKMKYGSLVLRMERIVQLVMEKCHQSAEVNEVASFNLLKAIIGVYCITGGGKSRTFTDLMTRLKNGGVDNKSLREIVVPAFEAKVTLHNGLSIPACAAYFVGNAWTEERRFFSENKKKSLAEKEGIGKIMQRVSNDLTPPFAAEELKKETLKWSIGTKDVEFNEIFKQSYGERQGGRSGFIGVLIWENIACHGETSETPENDVLRDNKLITFNFFFELMRDLMTLKPNKITTLESNKIKTLSHREAIDLWKAYNDNDYRETRGVIRREVYGIECRAVEATPDRHYVNFIDAGAGITVLGHRIANFLDEQHRVPYGDDALSKERGISQRYKLLMEVILFKIFQYVEEGDKLWGMNELLSVIRDEVLPFTKPQVVCMRGSVLNSEALAMFTKNDLTGLVDKLEHAIQVSSQEASSQAVKKGAIIASVGLFGTQICTQLLDKAVDNMAERIIFPAATRRPSRAACAKTFRDRTACLLGKVTKEKLKHNGSPFAGLELINSPVADLSGVLVDGIGKAIGGTIGEETEKFQDSYGQLQKAFCVSSTREKNGRITVDSWNQSDVPSLFLSYNGAEDLSKKNYEGYAHNAYSFKTKGSLPEVFFSEIYKKGTLVHKLTGNTSSSSGTVLSELVNESTDRVAIFSTTSGGQQNGLLRVVVFDDDGMPVAAVSFIALLEADTYPLMARSGAVMGGYMLYLREMLIDFREISASERAGGAISDGLVGAVNAVFVADHGAKSVAIYVTSGDSRPRALARYKLTEWFNLERDIEDSDPSKRKILLDMVSVGSVNGSEHMLSALFNFKIDRREIKQEDWVWRMPRQVVCNIREGGYTLKIKNIHWYRSNDLKVTDKQALRDAARNQSPLLHSEGLEGPPVWIVPSSIYSAELPKYVDRRSSSSDESDLEDVSSTLVQARRSDKPNLLGEFIGWFEERGPFGAPLFNRLFTMAKMIVPGLDESAARAEVLYVVNEIKGIFIPFLERAKSNYPNVRIPVNVSEASGMVRQIQGRGEQQELVKAIDIIENIQDSRKSFPFSCKKCNERFIRTFTDELLLLLSQKLYNMEQAREMEAGRLAGRGGAAARLSF